MASTPKYLLGFTVGGNAAAKAASLTGSGMMNAPAAHWFSNAWTFLPAGTQGGTKGVSMKQIAYVYFASLVWDDDMLNKSIIFFMGPNRTARLLHSADTGPGLPNAKFDNIDAARLNATEL